MANKKKELNEEELLRADNEFLKMKLMLEHGAEFHYPENGGERLDPQIANKFLNNILAFEKQFQEQKLIKVFDKIGKPKHFKPVAAIDEDAFGNEWRKLSGYMEQYGVVLETCSPKVMAKELYRFTVEELFEYEMDDMNLPGMMTNFIYDEFYPDHQFENTRIAIDDCISAILRTKPFEFMTWFAKENLQLNNHKQLSSHNFETIVNNFKNGLDEINLQEIENLQCDLQETKCKVTGSYKVILTFDGPSVTVAGNWLVEFVLDEGYWEIINVQINNLNI